MTDFTHETEQACIKAQQQAAHDIPYVIVGEARPYQYHYHSGRWYVEVDLQHHDPDQGEAIALYRIWRKRDGSLEAFKVDIREAPESEQDSMSNQDWKAIEAQAKADFEQIAGDQDAVAFIVKYFSKDLQADYLKIYRSDRYEMGRSPKQAINNLLRLPPLQ